MTGEGGAEAVNVAMIEICRPSYVFDVGLKKEGIIKDDT